MVTSLDRPGSPKPIHNDENEHLGNGKPMKVCKKSRIFLISA